MKTNSFDVEVVFKRILFANVLERKLKKDGLRNPG